MAGIFSRVSAFARSPQGRRLIQQAQEAAKDPKNRARVQELGNRLKDPATRARVQEYSRRQRAGQQASTRPRPDDSEAVDPRVHRDPEGPSGPRG